VAHIAEYPEAHEVVYRDVRKALARGISYSVFYVNEDGLVTVIAVMHWRRNPLDWQARAH